MNAFSALNSKSVRVRFVSTLIANILRFTMSMFSGMFVARALGPSSFGDFNFLLSSFASINILFEMGTSSAFFTFISRKKRSSRFHRYYAAWVAIQFIASLALATVLLPEVLRQKIWLGHSRGIVLLALFASFGTNQLWQTVSSTGESVRATIVVQLYNLGIAFVYLSMIVVLIKTSSLSVSSLFAITAIEYAVFSAFLVRRLKPMLIDPDLDEKITAKSIVAEFWAYCHPLAVFSLVNFLYIFTDNWLLQRYGGATEQGYYSIGMRFTYFSSIATASMLQVFWKEIAEASESGDDENIRALTYKVTRILYITSAVMSCFLIPFSRELLVWLAGPSYEKAAFSLSVLLLYPLHQSLGQVGLTMLLGLGMTGIYRNYGISVMLISIPITFFVLAPANAVFGIGGLGLAANGMALKTVGISIIGVNVMMWLIARARKWEFYISYQIAGVGILLSLAYASKFAAGWMLGAVLPSVSIPTLIILSGIFYSTLALGALYLFPSLTGYTRDEMHEIMDKVRSLIMSPEGNG